MFRVSLLLNWVWWSVGVWVRFYSETKTTQKFDQGKFKELLISSREWAQRQENCKEFRNGREDEQPYFCILARLAGKPAGCWGNSLENCWQSLLPNLAGSYLLRHLKLQITHRSLSIPMVLVVGSCRSMPVRREAVLPMCPPAPSTDKAGEGEAYRVRLPFPQGGGYEGWICSRVVPWW